MWGWNKQQITKEIERSLESYWDYSWHVPGLLACWRLALHLQSFNASSATYFLWHTVYWLHTAACFCAQCLHGAKTMTSTKWSVSLLLHLTPSFLPLTTRSFLFQLHQVSSPNLAYHRLNSCDLFIIKFNDKQNHMNKLWKVFWNDK